MFRPWEEDNKKKAEEHKGQWMHPEDDPLLSSANDFKTFRESSVWKDMHQLITERIEFVVDRLVMEDNDKEIAKLQSEIKTLQDMQVLPEYLEERCKLEKGETHAEN